MSTNSNTESPILQESAFTVRLLSPLSRARKNRAWNSIATTTRKSTIRTMWMIKAVFVGQDLLRMFSYR